MSVSRVVGEELARLMIERDMGVRTIHTIRVQRFNLEPYESDDVALAVGVEVTRPHI